MIIMTPYAYCMLQGLVHDIPNYDCGQGISYYSTYPSQLSFSDIDHFCVNLVSSLFCRHLQFEFLSVFRYLVRLWVAQSAVLCSCLPAAGSSTWTNNMGSVDCSLSI